MIVLQLLITTESVPTCACESLVRLTDSPWNDLNHSPDNRKIVQDAFTKCEQYYMKYDADGNRMLSLPELQNFMTNHLPGLWSFAQKYDCMCACVCACVWVLPHIPLRMSSDSFHAFTRRTSRARRFISWIFWDCYIYAAST